MQGLISVIVPVFNIEEYLERCINSILNQKYSNFELILVDDGSTDESGRIIDCFAKRDNRIIALHQENQGAGAARNAGLEKAEGEYVAFVDGDDFVTEDFLSHFWDVSQAYKSDYVICGVRRVKGEKKKFSPQKEKIEVFQGREAQKNTLLGRNGFTAGVCRGFYKKELFSGIRFLPKVVFEDLDILIRIQERVERVVMSHRETYYYCYRDSGSISTPLQKKLEDLSQVTQKMRGLAKKDEDLQTWIEARDMMNRIFILQVAFLQKQYDRTIFQKERRKILNLSQEAVALQDMLYFLYYHSLKLGLPVFRFTCWCLYLMKKYILKRG